MNDYNELVALNPGLVNVSLNKASLFNINRDTDRTSPKYKESDDLTIVQSLNNLGWFIDKYTQRKSRTLEKSVYKKYLATYTNPSLPTVSEGKFTLLQTNSKDGTTALLFDVGFFRFACANGLVIGSSLFDRIRLLHKGSDLNSRIESVINQALGLFPEVAKTIEAMQQTILSLNQIEDFATQAIELRLGKNSEKTFNPMDVTKVNRGEDQGNSLWTVLNRVQENLIKAPDLKFSNVVNKNGSNRKAREIKNIDLNMKINKGIWQLGESYLNA